MIFLRRFTFWFAAASLCICLNKYGGNDDSNILLVGLNPVLNAIAYTEPMRHWIFDYGNVPHPENSASIGVRFPAYMLHLMSFVLIGAIIDLLILKLRTKRVSSSS
ncbi:hypothetical protein ACFQI7_19995 [Paenibacillus allorhizosphaerae]|uniref:Uncharacterized protein n=1 Tax=Paenibacillus allorhizosphaerae TaxID=2849866 RepID=A0ABM8VKK7_9BACL|nr:hypothetical protein [Paenibacillus allorhizosphaerae]CAG7647284.1 hypothetical protein PAECIP111802_03936 [Paenibacillus allorhizosphaerae]